MRKPKPKEKPKSTILPTVNKIKPNLKARKLLKPYSQTALKRFEDLQKFREFATFLVIDGHVGIQNSECQVIPELFPWELFENATAVTATVSIGLNHALTYKKEVDPEYFQFKLRSSDVVFVCKLDLDSVGAIGKFLRISSYTRTYKEFLSSIETRQTNAKAIVESQQLSLKNSQRNLDKYTKLLLLARKKKTNGSS